MLPPVLDEDAITPFKFWFDNTIQDGTYYRHELFCRLYTIPIGYRARLFHYACKLAQSSMVLITATDDDCSIWVSLRSPILSDLKQSKPEFLTTHVPKSRY